MTMMNPTDDFLPAGLASLVDAELDKGERIAWIGRPIAWRYALRYIFVLLVGIPFTAFALFWMGAARGFPSAGVPVFALFGIPFVVIGLGMLLSPFWMLYRAGRTAYAITDRRALVVEHGLLGGVTVRSFEPGSLTILSRTQHADGSGNLVFQREYRREGRRGRFVDIGFLAVPDVREVEGRIRELAHRAHPPDGGR
jgi:hypothetical protein